MVRAKKGGGRGGPRQGAPGASYQNRSDMTQAPRAVPGQEYGAAGAQLASQQSVPLPTQGGAPGGGGQPAAQPQAPAPPLTPIDAPTQRPGEPLTSGIASGMGPGPEALGGGLDGLDPVDQIRAMFAAHPSDDMRRLLAYLDDGGGGSKPMVPIQLQTGGWSGQRGAGPGDASADGYRNGQPTNAPINHGDPRAGNIGR